MDTKVEVKSTQIYDNEPITQTSICNGEINYYDKGIKLDFTKQDENGKLDISMTLLDGKIITKRNKQQMIFDLKQRTKSQLNTTYGIIDMTITTIKMKVKKEKEKLKQIYIEYQIEVESNIRYLNKIDVRILEK